MPTDNTYSNTAQVKAYNTNNTYTGTSSSLSGLSTTQTVTTGSFNFNQYCTSCGCYHYNSLTCGSWHYHYADPTMKKELEDLKAQVKELTDTLKSMKGFKEAEDAKDEKRALVKKVADLVGVDLEDLLD